MKKLLFLLFILSLSTASAQDSSAAPSNQQIFGFQFSLVSGTGISYGRILENKIRVKGTGGFITNDNQSTYSLGIDFHYILSRGNLIEVSVGPSLGFIGGTDELTKTRLALATTAEMPVNGVEHFRNVCAGLVLYYPTLYILSGNINVTAGFYLAYYF